MSDSEDDSKQVHSLNSRIDGFFRKCLCCADSRGAQLESYVTTSLVQLLCRTTKLCWFDDDHFKTIVDDAKTLLAKGSSGSPVGRSPIPLCKSSSRAACVLKSE